MPDIKDPHKPGDDPLIEENPGAGPPAPGDDIPSDNQPESKLPGPLIGVWDAYEARPPYQQNDYIRLDHAGKTSRDARKTPGANARRIRTRRCLYEDVL